MRWWALLIIAAGCAKSLDDIGEFKCPANDFCPAGFSCSDGMCKRAAIDGPCQFSTLALHGDPCLDADASARCLIFDAQDTKGICAKACSTGQCDAGHVCAKDPTTLETYCLVDASGPCPPGTSPHMTSDAQGMQVSVCIPEPPAQGEDCWSSFACGLSASQLVCTFGTCVPLVDANGNCPVDTGGNLEKPVAGTVEGYGAKGCLSTCLSSAQCGAGESCLPSLNVCVHIGTRGVGVGCDSSIECASGYCLAEEAFTVNWHVCSARCSLSSCPAGFSCIPFANDASLDSCYLTGTDLKTASNAN